MSRRVFVLAAAFLVFAAFPASIAQSRANGERPFSESLLTKLSEFSKAGGGGPEWELEEVSVEDWNTDMEMFTIEIPEGWDYDYEIEWYDEPLPVYTVFFATFDETKERAWASLPMVGYIWYDDPQMRRLMPEGTLYLPNVYVMEPMDVEDYLADEVIPYLEEQYEEEFEINDFEIVDVERRRDIARDFEDLVDPEGVLGFYDYDAAVAYVTYEMDGSYVEERISIVIGTNEADLETLGIFEDEGVTYWALLAGIIERAPEGELDELEDMYEEILYSVRWNEDFQDEYWEMHEDAYRELQEEQERSLRRWED